MEKRNNKGTVVEVKKRKKSDKRKIKEMGNYEEGKEDER